VEGFLDFGEENVAGDGGMEGGGEQAVIAACADAAEGAHGEAAEAVGFQPFQGRRFGHG
jgi:hypothetical protein